MWLFQESVHIENLNVRPCPRGRKDIRPLDELTESPDALLTS